MPYPALKRHGVSGLLIDPSLYHSFILLAMILPVSITHTEAQSLPKPGNEYVVVTVPEKPEALRKNKKLKSYRPQLHSDTAGLEVRITQTTKLPRNIKKAHVRYRSQKGKSEAYSFGRKAMSSNMLAGEVNIHGPLESDRAAYMADTKRSTSSPGERVHDRSPGQWHTLTRTRSAQVNEDLSFRIKQGLFKRQTFYTDTLPVRNPVGFPGIDSNPCEPFDRFYARKQLKGYGLDKIKYEPYTIHNRKIIRKSFDVYFEKNKATLAQDQMQPIIDYLRENNLSILDIRIEGYSSIEGDSVLNRKLQARRAQQLIKLLQQYNNEPIARDTVIMAEAWEAFRTSRRTTSLKWLDTLSNTAMRNLLNSDGQLLERAEPLLKPLRRGKILITVARKLSTEDLVEKLFNDFNRTGLPLEDWKTSANAIAAIEAKLMGMIEYLSAMYQTGKIEGTTLARLVDECPFPQQARILHFYHLIKMHEAQKSQGPYETWDSLFVKGDWNNLFMVAHTNALELISYPRNPSDRTKRLRQMEDVQYYTIKYIEEGLLDAAVLCSIEYPHDSFFYGVRLNHYAIAYALSDRHELTCYGFKKDLTKGIPQPIRFNEEKLNHFLEERLKTAEDRSSNTKASFDVSEKGDYYFFIKTLLLSRDKSILQFVRTSDNFAEFDLYYLLRLTVDQWNPVTNYYYDGDIKLPEMDRLIRTMRTINKRICRTQLNQLYLDYYFKSLIHFSNYAIAGDKEELRIAEDALKYVSTYYQNHADRLFPKLTLYLADAFNSFYSFPTKRASTEYAAKIMHAVNKRTQLTDAEMDRWEVYRRMYYPDPKSRKSRTRIKL